MSALALSAQGAPLDFPAILAYAVLASLLAIACVTDLRERLIPNWIPITLACIWLAWKVVSSLAMYASISGASLGTKPDAVNLFDYLMSATTPGLIAALIFGGGLLAFSLAYETFAHKSAMGGGDIKLLAACALYLGLEGTTICLLVACVAAIPLALLIPHTRFSQTGERPGALPFAPAIATGVLVALLF